MKVKNISPRKKMLSTFKLNTAYWLINLIKKNLVHEYMRKNKFDFTWLLDHVLFNFYSNEISVRRKKNIASSLPQARNIFFESGEGGGGVNKKILAIQAVCVFCGGFFWGGRVAVGRWALPLCIYDVTIKWSSVGVCYKK